jgi:hypothetical protein
MPTVWIRISTCRCSTCRDIDGRQRIDIRGGQWMYKIHLIEVGLGLHVRQQLSLIRFCPFHETCQMRQSTEKATCDANVAIGKK